MKSKTEEGNFEKIMDGVSYIIGADYLADRLLREQEMLEQATGKPGPHLPIEGGIRVAGLIYAGRVRDMFIHPLLVATRVTGVDAVARRIRGRLSKTSSK